MELEIVVIEQDVKAVPMIKKCERCDESHNKMHYIGLKNTYYCMSCYDIIDNIDSAFDKKFKEIDKKLTEAQNSLIQKNSKIVFLENKLAELDSHLQKFCKLLESLNLDQ